MASTAVVLPNFLVNWTNSNAALAAIRIPSVLYAEDWGPGAQTGSIP
jgi:hypothetical protein